MQNTAYTPDDSSINITFGGLPFTSQSYAGGGGYNNNWFVGFGTCTTAILLLLNYTSKIIALFGVLLLQVAVNKVGDLRNIITLIQKVQ